MHLPNVLRIATRRSPLAMWQAEYVAGLLRSRHAELDVEIVPMSTQGDRVLDRALAEVGGKGLFVKELELALLDGRADVAVHSMKDVPSELPPRMCIGAVLPRANPLDAFVSVRHRKLRELPHAARVGTSSPRRQSQLRALRPDVQVELLRGNVQTRLDRLEAAQLDAILLACAGLERLGLASRITEMLPVGVSVPAVGQGIIGIECRDDDRATRERLAPLHDADAGTRLRAERAFAQSLEGSCHSPIAAHAVLDGGLLTLTGYVGAPDGREVYRDSIAGPGDDDERLGTELARRLVAAGAGALLDRLRREAATVP